MENINISALRTYAAQPLSYQGANHLPDISYETSKNILEYLSKAEYPYLIRSGNLVVKLKFSRSGNTLSDNLINIIRLKGAV